MTTTPAPAVLIVDDDDGICAVLAASLEGRGFHVQSASSGKEAATLLGNHHFDVVVTDMNMPGMNGLELIRWIRKAGLGIPVIPMSGAHPESRRLLEEAVELGGCSPLEKPFKIDQLLDALKRALSAET